MASSSRVARVADEIQKIIVSLLVTKVRDPRLKWVSITAVDVSKDLSYAKVFFSSLNKEVKPEDIVKAFKSATGFFRTSLAKELHLRVAPALCFFYDDSLIYGNKMNELIEKARKEDADFIKEEDDGVRDEKKTDQNDSSPRERLR
ncbi:30S ribosome-binding factor RbfA [Fastidiosibacter lacustris]|uniref:30S ribosome-binding factor RbfA n=1 Tax=Fastidiosibacter lacustris TaxID=2056695 RepID=UPI000E34C82A|nr:30S ribosome-binding factor RbfA [Fastidiosibacter lacustris]